MSYTEAQLKNWSIKPSDTELRRADHAIDMIRSAIGASEELRGIDTEIFVQGSYANNTNVRAGSDVDVCVMSKKVFKGSYPRPLSGADYGFSSGIYTFDEFRELVLEAMRAKFGSAQVSEGNKSLKIDANTYHVQADVVPALQLRNYRATGSRDSEHFVEGIWFKARDGQVVINYPKQHIANGRQKNVDTSHRYKSLVRILKHIRNDMVDTGLADGSRITSFFVECLMWNVTDEVITGSSSWAERTEEAVRFLRNELSRGIGANWNEVSEMLPLFGPDRKWTMTVAQEWLSDVWARL